MMGYRTSWMAGDFAIPIIQGVRHLQEGPGSPNVGTSDDFGLSYLKRQDPGTRSYGEARRSHRLARCPGPFHGRLQQGQPPA